ncbi:hypothetical protein QN277_016313 [Acacia crassicarpa]|uniref:Uncharacterized protein n=1 Tax=Acacia crassicarpa TaxID=499986 RepID=A0AAE1MWG9_9FABA|nr:hypothetical protein QN277_016313 [Acacia crassicarpa]
MEKVGDIIWDITKYLCGCAKQQANLICGLEENLQSLEAKWNDLEAMKKDVEEKIKADEETGEVQRSHAVTSVANVFGKPKTITDFLPYNNDGFKLNIPSKWNPSKEVEFGVSTWSTISASQDLRGGTVLHGSGS